MSSAISIDKTALKAREGSAGPETRAAPAPPESDGSFRVWHFFVLVSLLAATAAVVVTRQGRPEVLLLVSLTIGAAGAAAAAFHRTLAPLTRPDTNPVSEPLSVGLRTYLEREKALTLRSIKELEFDRAMGKVSPADFDEMAGRLRARALGIMQQLDADRSPYRAVIEQELARRRSDGAQPEAGLASHRDRPEDARAGSACACGTANDDDARFCKSCGARLRTA